MTNDTCLITHIQHAAIVGAGGGLGSLACQYAKACGYRVLALSSGAEKKEMCLSHFGVEFFVDYIASTDVVAEVKSLTKGGPHAVIVVAAAEEPLQLAIQVGYKSRSHHHLLTSGSMYAQEGLLLPLAYRPGQQSEQTCFPQ